MIATQEITSVYTRFILTSYGGQTLVFPDAWVDKIILTDRAYLLTFPFFAPPVLGVIQNQGTIIPLISLRRIFGEPAALVPETISVVRLASPAMKLAGVGLVVDKVLGSVSAEQFDKLKAAQVQPNQVQPNQVQLRQYMRIEALLSQIPESIWQPQRWQPQ